MTSSPHTPTPLSGEHRNLHRRELLRGGLWAAPTIALAVAAPAAAASGMKTTTRFNTPPQMFIQGSTWNPAINANVAQGYRFETKFENIYQLNAVTIITTDIVISYPAAYIADVPLTSLSSGLTELSRVVSGGTITFTIRLTESIGNSASSSNLTWIATAKPGVPTAQAVNFTASVTSPQASTVLTHSGANPTW